jgi:hypothetical protein
MSNLWVQENWVDASRGIRIGDSDIYEAFTSSPGELFRDLQREYGRCGGKVYVGEGQQVGWWFEKKKQYDDSEDTFTLQTWVTLHKGPPTETVEYHYAELR